ncbi:class I SAM-dependent DNA methyltransferase [Peribacillus alkalitolerans]|uniref:class I SAM-dependent DNA methyltransferase n=1 Tax=Peribacillus alkalitolerans TaxID=1550385 RepID=UPI0013CF62D0|nr:class I SAM-dependent methyltransferase [Peribacillus alkalitolerans]
MGREFLDVFENWADSYDETVIGHDEEYKEVFRHYEQILKTVADKSIGHVLEFGVGTGNLTQKLLEKGHKVTGIEPSEPMKKIAEEKLAGNVILKDGDFLEFSVDGKVDSIVSTYAFHHLTDEEKEKAVRGYGNLLATGGKIVFADTMYETKESYNQAIKNAEEKGFLNLANDLQTEYYTTIPFLNEILDAAGFEVKFSRCNDFVWILEATKL